jgi:hypothetical protein
MSTRRQALNDVAELESALLLTQMTVGAEHLRVFPIQWHHFT